MPELKDELASLRNYREELARRHNGDACSLLRELAEQGKAAGRVYVTLPPRVPEPPVAVEPQEPAA